MCMLYKYNTVTYISRAAELYTRRLCGSSRPLAGGPCGPTNKIQLQVVRICKPIEVPDATQKIARAQ